MNTIKTLVSPKTLNTLFLFLFACVVLFFIGCYSYCNLDLTVGSYALHMDEQITFFGVKKYYQTSTLSDWWYLLSDGGDNRYGRILWNTLALISFIPYKIFGDSGLIFMNRMGCAGLLIASYCLLCFAFIKGAWLRLICLISLVSLSYTMYYSSVPKPEPIQLFILTVGLVLHKKNRDKSAFLFYGMAFGAKISFLPGALFLIGRDFISNFTDKKKTFFQNFLSFILGWFLVVPILFSFQWSRFFNSTYSVSKLLTDDPNINASTWFFFLLDHYWLKQYFVPFFIITASMLLWLFFKNKETVKFNKPFLNKLLSNDLATLAVLSFSFWGPVFLFVKRYWAFYLHLGSVLAVVFFFLLWETFRFKYKPVVTILMSSLLAAGLIKPFKSIYKGGISLATRTESPQFTIPFARMKKIETELLNLNRENSFDDVTQQAKVAIDARMFYKKNMANHSFEPFYNKYNFRAHYDETRLDPKQSPLFIFFLKDRLDEKKFAGTPKNKLHMQFINQYKKHLSESPEERCLQEPCYLQKKLDGYPDVIYLSLHLP